MLNKTLIKKDPSVFYLINIFEKFLERKRYECCHLRSFERAIEEEWLVHVEYRGQWRYLNDYCSTSVSRIIS